jgi:hypothetical protein
MIIRIKICLFIFFVFTTAFGQDATANKAKVTTEAQEILKKMKEALRCDKYDEIKSISFSMIIRNQLVANYTSKTECIYLKPSNKCFLIGVTWLCLPKDVYEFRSDGVTNWMKIGNGSISEFPVKKDLGELINHPEDLFEDIEKTSDENFQDKNCVVIFMKGCKAENFESVQLFIDKETFMPIGCKSIFSITNPHF